MRNEAQKVASLQEMDSLSLNAEETKKWGEELGRSLPPGSIVALFGDLGAGKTTFIKGLVQGAANIEASQVSSPTFTYLHIYTGTLTVYHFDLYRLKDMNEFSSMGFDEYFAAGGICCIEWPERILPLLPKSALKISLSYRGEGQRQISISRGEI